MTHETPKAQIVKFTCNKEDDGKLLVDVIAENSSLSKSLIKKLMVFGAVFQSFKGNKVRARKAKRTLKAGDAIECYFDPKIDIEQEFEFKSLYENKYYGIFHKPAGALTEGTSYGDKISLCRHVEKFKKSIYLINRLDKETEGLVVIAFDSKTQNLLQTMWRNEVTKKYQAIILGELEGEGEFDNPVNDKFSHTHYQCIKTENNQTYVDVTVKTERKHQIRIHFSHDGHPIMGDPIYGKNNKNKEGLKLISYLIEFKDPYSKAPIKVLLPQERMLF